VKNQKMGIYSISSKIGNIVIFSNNNHIEKISFNLENIKNDKITSLLQKTKSQIEEYLDKTRFSFDLPFVIVGTDFQRRILSTICQIPYGEKWSYSKVAKLAGFEGAARACGTVCKNNLLPIIIPCHRVVKSDGSISQYSGGVTIKKQLLEMECI
jgi:methylated-DNA-[protein]-cysteine S-methyltransferase